MNPLSHDQRIEAICRLEAAGDKYPAPSTLKAIDKLLVFGEVFSYTDPERIVGKRAYPLQVERGIELFLMMARLMNLCEPKGQTVGPACAVRRIDFEHLTREEALDLKNGIGFRVLNQPSLSKGDKFSGLDLLTTEEKELYKNIKPHFDGRGKPTLQILAARLLRDPQDRSFSDRSVGRYIDALKNYEFVDENRRRDYLISSANYFGTHNKSATGVLVLSCTRLVILAGLSHSRLRLRCPLAGFALTTQAQTRLRYWPIVQRSLGGLL
jgi:hypothetical protein